MGTLHFATLILEIIEFKMAAVKPKMVVIEI